MSDIISKELISEIGKQIEPSKTRMNTYDRETFKQIIFDITTKAVQIEEIKSCSGKLDSLIRLHDQDGLSRSQRENIFNKIQDLM